MAKNKIKGKVWKILSIIFIILFAFVVLGGLWRAYHFRPNITTATPAQIETAKNIALADLNSRGETLTNYSFKVSDKIRDLPLDRDHSNVSKINFNKVIEVLVYNGSVHHNYIIDIGSGIVLMHSKTEFYDGLNHDLNHSIDGPNSDRDSRRDKGGDFFRFSR